MCEAKRERTVIGAGGGDGSSQDWNVDLHRGKSAAQIGGKRGVTRTAGEQTLPTHTWLGGSLNSFFFIQEVLRKPTDFITVKAEKEMIMMMALDSKWTDQSGQKSIYIHSLLPQNADTHRHHHLQPGKHGINDWSQHELHSVTSSRASYHNWNVLQLLLQAGLPSSQATSLVHFFLAHCSSA